MSDGAAETTAAGEAGGPPAAPREVTARVRRRAWGEPRVRRWWVLALALVVVVAVACMEVLPARYHDAWLRREGRVVQAQVWEAGMARAKGRPVRPDMTVQLEFEWDGRPAKVVGSLRRRERTELGEWIPLHVNPANAEDWTDLTEATPLAESMVAPLLLLPLIGAFYGAAWWARRGVVRAWETGEAARGVVVRSRHATLAPRSWVVEFVLSGGGAGQRLRRVYVPYRAGMSAPRRDEGIWVVMPPGRPERAVSCVGWGDR